MNFVALAIVSGVFAAFASVFMKLATDAATTKNRLFSLGCSFCDVSDVYLTAFCLVCFALSNAIMWKTFSDALSQSPNSFNVSMINSALNIITTVCMLMQGIAGFVLFEEPVSIKWWAGSALMVLGSTIISTNQQSDSEKEKSE
jgi:drug/metabolite transporter (DMT)-like permease